MRDASRLRARSLIESLGLAGIDTWSAGALMSCLESMELETAHWVRVVDAELRSADLFHVLYRKQLSPDPSGFLCGTVGNRDDDATLLLMPHYEPADLPLTAQEYGTDFAIVGIVEPFGLEDYAEPDDSGVRWFMPTNFRAG